MRSLVSRHGLPGTCHGNLTSVEATCFFLVCPRQSHVFPNLQGRLANPACKFRSLELSHAQHAEQTGARGGADAAPPKGVSMPDTFSIKRIQKVPWFQWYRCSRSHRRTLQDPSVDGLLRWNWVDECSPKRGIQAWIYSELAWGWMAWPRKEPPVQHSARPNRTFPTLRADLRRVGYGFRQREMGFRPIHVVSEGR